MKRPEQIPSRYSGCKWRLLGSGLLLCLGILSGCNRKQPDALRVVMNLSESEWAVMRQQVIPAFEEQTGIAVNAFQIPSGQLAAKLEALMTAGQSEIDVFAQDNMSLATLVNNDLVLDLSAYEDRIPDAVLTNLTAAGRFDGKLLFMPFRPNVQITYYNRTAFENHNLTVPQTWDDLLAVARQFHEAEKTGRIVIKGYGGNPTATQIYEFILQAGGDPYAFDDDGCIAAFQFLQDLKPYLSPESGRAKWDTVNAILARKEAYIAQNWPFGVSILIRDYGLDFIGTYSGWAGPAGRRHVIGGDVLGIPRNTKRQNEALAFIAFLQSQSVQTTLVRELAWPSIRNDAYTKVADWQKPHFESVMKALEKGVFRRNVSWWPAYQQVVVQAFQDIVMDGADVASTLHAYKQELEDQKGRFE